MKVNILNMVCDGTKSFVIQELERLGFKYYSIVSGIIDFKEDLSSNEIEKLKESMDQYGLVLTLQNAIS